MVQRSDPPLVECLEALHRVGVGVFDQILGPKTENDISTFEEAFMGTMRTHNPRMTPKVHVLVHHASEYVCRSGIQLRPTSEQAPHLPPKGGAGGKTNPLKSIEPLTSVFSTTLPQPGNPVLLQPDWTSWNPAKIEHSALSPDSSKPPP